MKKDFLLEVLVQELPYKFIPSAIAQLKSSFEELFKNNGLEYGKINVYATPRRLALIVDDLTIEQETVVKDVKGPILNIAKKDGEYYPAALGFAKKNNVDVSALYEKDNYIWAKVEIKGKNAAEVIRENVEKIIIKLQGSHFMRWGYNTEKFSRPIENVVAILGNDVVELSVFNVKSSNKTKGHRYSGIKEVIIDEPKNYIALLKQANVIVNQEEREKNIIERATKCASDNGLTIDFSGCDELLEEITYITEWPVPVLCEFNEKYLEIPSIVTTTVMTQHQRYFPLWNNGKLSNKFITMANYVGNEFENIKAGNQRVIVARLDDGIFFYKEDTKTKLIDKLDNLKGMTFQKRLGSLYEKTQRMVKLSDYIADLMNINDKSDILRCATLAKCDLSTKLVFEFTELQGFIGSNYALLDNEKEIVANGVSEHYFPLAANSDLPSTIVSQVVSIADKIDTICALFISTQGDKKKKRPTGSNDPLGARRAAIGILRTIIEKDLDINLEKVIVKSLEMLSSEFQIKLEDSILDDLKEFFNLRLMFMYEKEISTNVFNSCCKFNALGNLKSFVLRVKLLEQYKNDSDFISIKENATRVNKILKDNSFNIVDEKLFVADVENNLYSAIKKHNQDIEKLDEYIKSLSSLIKPTADFFEKVLVMDKDEKIKNNRIALLNLLRNKFNLVCDFEKLN